MEKKTEISRESFKRWVRLSTFESARMKEPYALKLAGFFGFKNADGTPDLPSFVHAADTTPMPVPEEEPRKVSAASRLAKVAGNKLMTPESIAKASGVDASVVESLLKGKRTSRDDVQRVVAAILNKGEAPLDYEELVEDDGLPDHEAIIADVSRIEDPLLLHAISEAVNFRLQALTHSKKESRKKPNTGA